jgi:DNA-nicking Smr family endonuclease
LADRGAEKRVRRGKLEIVGKLDLHGYGQDAARAALIGFLLHKHAEGGGVVIVVTGKGGRLRNGETAPGVLRQRLPEWLAAPELRPILSGYAQAHRGHGGAGAYYVFVRGQPSD